MNVGLVIPTWGRSVLTNRVLRYWASVPMAHRIAVVSPEDPDPCTVPDGFERIEAPNHMQTKFQSGFTALRGRVDVVMIMGSDDIATPGFTEKATAAAWEHGHSYPRSLYAADEATRRVSQFRYRTVGAGRCYSALVLDRVSWYIYHDEKNPERSPDFTSRDAMVRLGVGGVGMPHLDDMGEVLVDIKTGVNCWSYNWLRARAARRNTILGEYEWNAFFDTHFPGFWHGSS